MKQKLSILLMLLLSAVQALAATEPSHRAYVVVSMIGDALTVVTYQLTVGRSTDSNLHQTIKLPDAALDYAALGVVNDAIKQADSLATPALFTMPASALPTEQSALFDGDRFLPFDALTKVLRATPATHLIILTKYRAEANLQMEHGKIGAGKLQGLGFYIDRSTPVLDADTRERGTGFLACYAYIRLSLVDLVSRTVIRQKVLPGTTTVAASRNNQSMDPWEALSPSEKVAALKELIQGELRGSLPELLRP